MTARQPEPRLYPQPQRIRLDAAPAGERLAFVQDSTLRSEGYRICADADGVVVRHSDAAGRRFAQSTLAQLRALHGGVVPSGEVEDWPDLPVRGFLLDVSRGRVPTRPTLERLVELLALGRYNHLQLYVEHTFAYAGHDAVWADASPLTGDDLRWLDETCRAAGIDLAANQASFGHLGRWLTHEPYRSLAECPSGWEPLPGYTAPPTVLAPSPESADFALALVREQLGFLSTDVVNIGCDETFELGRGRSRARVETVGIGAVFADHVNEIARPLLAEGRSVLAWADMLAKHPEGLPRLDRDITSLVWSYDAPGARPPRLSARQATVAGVLGFDTGPPPAFAELVRPHVETGRDFWVCPGTSTWNSIVGRSQNARANLLDAAVAGRDHGASGYLVADWGDNGHLQPPSVSFSPLLYGGAVAWCAETNAGTDVTWLLDEVVFEDSAAVLGRCVEQLAAAAAATGVPALNASPLFSRVLPQALCMVDPEVDPDGMTTALGAIDDALVQLRAARPACADGELVVRELELAARLTRIGALRALAEAGVPAHDDEGVATHGDLLDDFRSSWLARSRPGGLDESLRMLTAGLTAAAEAPTR